MNSLRKWGEMHMPYIQGYLISTIANCLLIDKDSPLNVDPIDEKYPMAEAIVAKMIGL